MKSYQATEFNYALCSILDSAYIVRNGIKILYDDDENTLWDEFFLSLEEVFHTNESRDTTEELFEKLNIPQAVQVLKIACELYLDYAKEG